MGKYNKYINSILIKLFLIISIELIENIYSAEITPLVCDQEIIFPSST